MSLSQFARALVYVFQLPNEVHVVLYRPRVISFDTLQYF